MNAPLSSPEVLQALWDEYLKHRDFKVSKREISRLLDLDPNALSKWTGKDAPSNRRIPAEYVPMLAEGLMLSQRDADLLMKVRLREMMENPSIAAAIEGAVNIAKRNMARRHALDQDEQLVLAAFRRARAVFPRGLYLDEDHLIEMALRNILARAEELHTDEYRGEAENPDISKAIARVNTALKQNKRARPNRYKAALSQAKRVR